MAKDSKLARVVGHLVARVGRARRLFTELWLSRVRRELGLVGVFQAGSTAVTIVVVKVVRHVPSVLSVKDPSGTLAVMWQVQAAFASIAFAGLAVLLQVAAEPVVTSKSVRQVLFRHTKFVPALGLSLLGTLQLGVISIWFAAGPAVIFEFGFVVVTTIGGIGYAYWRAAQVYTRPGEANRLGTRALIADALNSIDGRRRQEGQGDAAGAKPSQLEDFRSSVGALRDNVVVALEHSDLGKALEGFAVYTALLIAIYDHAAALGSAAGKVNEVSLAGGREWDQVIRDLYVVVDVASESRSSRTWVEVVDWCRAVVMTFAGLGDPQAARPMFGLIELMWTRESTTDRRDRSTRQVPLLLRLSEMSAYNIHRSSDPELTRALDTEVARSFTNITKSAINNHNATSGVLAVKYLAHALHDDSQAILRISTALALYAWILYLVEDGQDDLPSVRYQLTNLVDRSPEPIAALLPQALGTESDLGWKWWQFRGPDPIQSAVLQMPHFIHLAAIFLGFTAPPLVGRPDSIDSWTAHRLVDALKSLSVDPPSHVRELLPQSDADLARVREQLQQIIDADELRHEQERALIELSDERRRRFRDALVDELTKERNTTLVGALQTTWVPAPDDNHQPIAVEILVPRPYFADTDVFANPENLARTIAKSIVRREQDTILGRVLAELSNAPTSERDALVDTLQRHISDLRDPSTLVVTNSSHVSKLARETGGVARLPAALGSARLQRIINNDRPPFVAILNGNGAPHVHIEPAEPSVDVEEIITAAAIVLGIKELTQDETDAIIGQESRTELEKARLRAQVRVQVGERLFVRLDQPDRLYLFRLTEQIK